MKSADDIPSVLIVDDRQDKLVTLQAILDDMGLNIVTANSGRNALRCLLHQEFAVILLDVQMPDIDGFETASLIRQRASLEHTPIIFVTAYGDDMHVAQGYSLGAVDFILAPVVPEILRTKVAVFIDLYRKSAELRRHVAQWERRAFQLQKLNEAALAIHSALEMDDLLQLIADKSRDMFGAELVSIVATAGVGVSQTHKAVARLSPAQVSKPLTPNALELEWLSSRLPQHVVRLKDRDKIQRYLQLEGIDPAQIQRLEGGLLVAPLLGRGNAKIGVMLVFSSYQAGHPEEDEALIVQFVQTASIAIENTLFAEAREANRLKDEFLATLSHELRTPLTAMLGWVELLKMQAVTGDEMAHGLDVIERNILAQTKLIDDLLDVSRIATGKMRLNLRRMDLRNPVQAAIDMVRPQVDSKHLSLEVDLGARPAVLCGDAERLQQVFWNLLTNAVKFTPKDGRISVHFEQQDAQLTLKVTDSGQGIPAGFLPHVFDRFRQADSTTTRSHGGLGIGLSLVQHVVQLHGGSVRAESQGDGCGSVFTVQLPGDSGPLSQKPGDVSSESLLGRPLAEKRTMLQDVRVLVVDDQPDAREMLARLLEMCGASVFPVGSAPDALEAIGREPFDLLISDIGLPGMDGYALVGHLRRDNGNPNTMIPAIAVTAFAREEDRQRALSAGYDAHMAKPIVPNDLAQLSRQLVASHKPRRGKEPSLIAPNGSRFDPS